MRRPGTRVSNNLWGEEGLDLAGAREVAEETMKGETEGEEGEAEELEVKL